MSRKVMRAGASREASAAVAATADRSFSGVEPDAIASREIMGGFAKGLLVIESFGRGHEALTIADVAKAAGLDRATARRCLLTLLKLGYAESDERRFRLTGRVLRLGYAYLIAAPLPQVVQPYLERLSEKTGESCSCSILDNDEILYVARAAQRRVLSITLKVGSRLPAYCASMGRVLLAALPVGQARSVLARSERSKLTPATITDLHSLMAVLNTARVSGYAIVDEELEVGLRSIAVPLTDARGKVVAAINVGLPAAKMTCDRMVAEILPELRAVQSIVRPLLA